MSRVPAPLRFSLIGVIVVLVMLLAGSIAYAASQDGRVYRGVRVLGQDLSGMTAAEARAALTTASAGYPSGQVQVSGDGKSWSFSPADLGLAVDVDKTVSSAMSVGRDNGFLADLGRQVNTLLGGAQVVPALKYDSSLVDKAVASIAAGVDRPAVDSKLVQGGDGKVAITPSATGSVVDRNATKAALVASMLSVPFVPASVSMREDSPKITESALKGAEAQALLLTEQPIALQSGDQSWTVTTEQLRGMLDLSTSANGDTTVTLANNALASYLQPVAADMHVEPKDAAVVIGDGTVTLKEDKSGSDLDVPAAIAAIEKAATGSDPAGRSVTLPTKVVEASLHTADVQAVYNQASGLVKQGIRLRFRDDGYILRGSNVTGFIDTARTQGGPGYKLTIDQNALSDSIAGVAYYINRSTSDARFRVVNGTPTKVADAKEGFKVDVDKSLQTTMQAIQGYTGGDKLQVDLTVAVTQPNVTSADLSSINTPDLLGTGQTTYAGSSPERAWNVGLGTRNIDGALIPPGGIFSTDDTIGDLTLAAGFKMGYAIVNTGAGLTTVPAEAGGICQVSTTLFHSVFWAGIPVVERHWHSYWINIYGIKPSGIQGLDATISPPDLDFRFKNTTGNWLRISATADGKNVTFKLYGVNPHWNVSVGGPVITNHVTTSQAPITETSSALPAGRKVLVEHAQDGFDASITRVVRDSAGNVIDKLNLNSHYQPAHNRYLVGTGQ